MKVEFETRLAVMNAYKAGQFCDPSAEDCKPIFDVQVTDYEVYRVDPRAKEHRESYGQVWDENFESTWKKLRREGK